MRHMGLMGSMSEVLYRLFCRERFTGSGNLFRTHQWGVPCDGIWRSIPGMTLGHLANESQTMKLANLANLKPA